MYMRKIRKPSSPSISKRSLLLVFESIKPLDSDQLKEVGGGISRYGVDRGCNTSN